MAKCRRSRIQRQEKLYAQADNSKPNREVKLEHHYCPKQLSITKRVPLMQPPGSLCTIVRLPCPCNIALQDLSSSMSTNIGLPTIQEVTSTRHSKEAERNTRASPVVLLPPKPFNFLGLPGEIRNKVYTLVFPSDVFQIKYLTTKHKSLTYRSARNRYTQGPYISPRTKLAASTEERRREHNLYRWRKNIDGRPKYHVPPGPTALLHTCQLINEETSTIFYGRNWFVFDNPWTLRAFTLAMRPSTKATIKNIKVRHQTHGEPRYTKDRPFKIRYDLVWSNFCTNPSTELPGMPHNIERLNLHLEIKDNPCFLNMEADWAKPLLTLGNRSLRDVSVSLSSVFKSDEELKACAEVLRRELLGKHHREDEDETIRLRSRLPRSLQIVPARPYFPE